MKRSKIIIVSIVVILVVLISVTLYSNKKEINEKSQAGGEKKTLVIPVIVDTVNNFTPASSLRKTGNISPFKQSLAVASSAGNIRSINFELGTKVSAGQVLAVTDPQKINIDLQNALAKEKKLQNELNTYVELLAGKATTKEKVNQLRLDYTDSKFQTSQLRQQINDTRILAPISGIVTEKKVEQGLYVNSGTEIATIVDLNKVKVQVYLTESEVYQVKTNDITKITNDVFPDRIFNGKVTYVSPQGDETHSYLCEITINNPDNNLLKSGSFVYVDFNAEDIQPILSVKREALIENTQKPTVYVVQNNKTIRKEIRTGRDFGDRIEVLSGLSRGDIVVVSGQINLQNQSSVKITNNKSK